MEGTERVLSRVYDLLDKCSHCAHTMGGNRTHTTTAEPQTSSVEDKAQVNYAARNQESKFRTRTVSGRDCWHRSVIIALGRLSHEAMSSSTAYHLVSTKLASATQKDPVSKAKRKTKSRKHLIILTQYVKVK